MRAAAPDPFIVHFIEFTCAGERCVTHRLPYGRSKPGVALYVGDSPDECHAAARADGWSMPFGERIGYFCLACVPAQATC